MAKKNIVKITLIKDMDQLSRLIASIKGRGAKLQHDIHRAALGCLVQLHKHGNVIPCRDLLDAVPAMGRRNALIDWFSEFGPCRFDEVEKKLVYDKDKKERGEKEQTAKINAGMNAPFWEFSPEPEYKQVDLVKGILALVQRAEKAVKKDEQDKKLIPADTLQALRLVVNK